MREPIYIKPPRPSLEERAKKLRIPKASRKAIEALIEEFKAQYGLQEDAPVNLVKPEKRRKRASAA